MNSTTGDPHYVIAPHPVSAVPVDGSPKSFPVRRIYCVGRNYAEHSKEMGHDPTREAPFFFQKNPDSLLIDGAPFPYPSKSKDVHHEVELVVAIGRAAHRVSEEAAYGHVAGFMVGQDLSERVVQLAGPVPQFSLGKSYPGFAPLGPALVTVDEIEHPDDLELGCRLGDEVLQRGRTRDLMFSVPELISRLSAVCPLLPGDIIFTGTPSGVGNARDPKRFIPPGSVLIFKLTLLGWLSAD